MKVGSCATTATRSAPRPRTGATQAAALLGSILVDGKPESIAFLAIKIEPGGRDAIADRRRRPRGGRRAAGGRGGRSHTFIVLLVKSSTMGHWEYGAIFLSKRFPMATRGGGNAYL